MLVGDFPHYSRLFQSLQMASALSSTFPGSLFLVSAPSGAGKSSLVNAALARDPALKLSISCTTRAPRPGEVDGREYRFVTPNAFAQLRDANQLLEWAEVHGNHYGTPRDFVDATLQAGEDIILEIDWQGARQVKQMYPQAQGIFILPPSIATLKSRLEQRGQDTPETIARRLRAAEGEIAHAGEFEYVIINQEFSVALQELTEIVAAARRRFVCQAARHAALFTQFGLMPHD